MKSLKRNFKIITAMIMVAVTLVTLQLPASAEVVDITFFKDWNFYGKSATEPKALQADCEAISLWATCEGDEVDTVTAFIVDRTYGGIYNTTISFPADGNVITYPYTFPEGRYYVYFTGSDNIKKTEATMVFSRVE